MSTKRILKELGDLQANPPTGATVALAPSQDIHAWNITLLGPAGTPYERGTFALVVRLPAEYPFKPPSVRFGTRIYHPNVTDDGAGSVCLAILKPDQWKPSTQMRGVIEAVRALLMEPQPDDPLEARIADEFRNERDTWEKKARKATQEWASSGAVEFKEVEG
jgi:ubiquitin-protein ligase